MSLSLQSLLLANRCLVALSEERRHAVSAQFNLPIESVATTTDHPGWHKLYYGVTAKKAEKHLAELAKDFPAVAALLAPAVAQSLSTSQRPTRPTTTSSRYGGTTNFRRQCRTPSATVSRRRNKRRTKRHEPDTSTGPRARAGRLRRLEEQHRSDPEPSALRHLPRHAGPG